MAVALPAAGIGGKTQCLRKGRAQSVLNGQALPVFEKFNRALFRAEKRETQLTVRSGMQDCRYLVFLVCREPYVGKCREWEVSMQMTSAFLHSVQPAAAAACVRLRRSGAALALMASLTAALTVPAAHAACAYETLPHPHPDGIAKAYCGRPIARVMGWQAAGWLNRPERVREERTDLLVERLGLKPGWVVGDIGAGAGTLSKPLLQRIQPGGTVWAVDIQPQMVEMLRRVASEFKPGQMEVRQTALQAVNIPDETLDLAVMVDVYHELEFPRETLQSLARAVKSGGRIAFVEYRANDPFVPIKPIHTMTQAQIRKEAETAGLLHERTDTTLPWQDIVVFKKPSATPQP